MDVGDGMAAFKEKIAGAGAGAFGAPLDEVEMGGGPGKELMKKIQDAYKRANTAINNFNTENKTAGRGKKPSPSFKQAEEAAAKYIQLKHQAYPDHFDNFGPFKGADGFKVVPGYDQKVVVVPTLGGNPITLYYNASYGLVSPKQGEVKGAWAPINGVVHDNRMSSTGRSTYIQPEQLANAKNFKLQ